MPFCNTSRSKNGAYFVKISTLPLILVFRNWHHTKTKSWHRQGSKSFKRRRKGAAFRARTVSCLIWCSTVFYNDGDEIFLWQDTFFDTCFIESRRRILLSSTPRFVFRLEVNESKPFIPAELQKGYRTFLETVKYWFASQLITASYCTDEIGAQIFPGKSHKNECVAHSSKELTVFYIYPLTPYIHEHIGDAPCTSMYVSRK